MHHEHSHFLNADGARYFLAHRHNVGHATSKLVKIGPKTDQNLSMKTNTGMSVTGIEQMQRFTVYVWHKKPDI